MNQTSPKAVDIAQNCVAFRFRKLGRQVSRIFNEALKPFGAQVSQVNLLVPLANVEQGWSPTSLCTFMEMDKSTLSRNMAVMQKRGWVTTRQGLGANIHYQITDEGRALIEKIHPHWQKANQEAKILVLAMGKELDP